MWILQCDGDLLQHKKTWLKPGHQYLFGRTKVDVRDGEISYAITHKSVSRKHLIIAVSPVKPGQGSERYAKSTLTITDESKLGTYLDGDRFIKESRTLTKNEHTIVLGSFEPVFRITWKPVIISFQIPDKQAKASADILAPYRARLEVFDIKTILDYIIAETTHVVSSKRNVPRGLQALINGRFLVTEDFIDAVERAASSSGLAADGTSHLPSPLEEDVEANWPDPMQYIPDAGREPVPRPKELLAPNAARISMFEGYTFIFSDQTQFEVLSSVVTNGGAKALKFDMRLGLTTLEEFVQYVKSVAGKKGIGKFGDESQGKGVVVVRFRGKADTEEWALSFLRELDRELEQRSIEQNEFLDAILTTNASALRKPLLEEETQGIRAPPSTAVTTRALETQRRSPDKAPPPSSPAQNDTTAPSAAETQHPSAARSRARRIVTQSRFKGFDDFDPSQLPKVQKRDSDSSIEEEEEEDEGRRPNTQSQHASAMEVDSQTLFISDSQPQRSSRKRHAPSPIEDDNAEADMVDSLLPAAAAMKKRRLEDEAAGRTTSFRERSVDVDSQKASKKAGRKVPVKMEIDVRSAAREHAEKLDAQRNRSESQPVQGDDGVDDSEIAHLRNLAIVEEMDILPRARATRPNTGGETDRWDDRWNGRKNFKKFRKHVRGEGDNPAAVPNNRARKVIVTLEEVKRKDYGIGDDYWLEPSTTSTKDRSAKKGRLSQSQSQSQVTPQRLARDTGEEESELIPEEVAGQPREGPVAEALREIGERGKVGAAPTTARGKRPAAAVSKAAPPAKRLKQVLGTGRRGVGREVEEDSSEDEHKFRFSRKR